MKVIECPRESDVLDAVASARWPHRVPRELADHVASCAICADVVVVAEAMRADHDAVWQQADIPSSGQVWWRAEMRARQEAIRKASRPITIAQGVAALLVLTVTASGRLVRVDVDSAADARLRLRERLGSGAGVPARRVARRRARRAGADHARRAVPRVVGRIARQRSSGLEAAVALFGPRRPSCCIRALTLTTEAVLDFPRHVHFWSRAIKSRARSPNCSSATSFSA